MHRSLRSSIWVLAAAAATLLICGLLVTHRLPLGVAGEWEWGRIEDAGAWPDRPLDWLVVSVGVAGYLAFVRLGWNWMRRPGLWSRGAAVLALVPAAFAVQMSLQPLGHGLAKWPLVLYFRGSSGYFTAARTEVRSAGDFLARYPEIQKEFHARYGPFHLATHPPGLVLLHYGAIQLCETNPGLTDWLLGLQPAGVRDGFRIAARDGALPPTDQASIWLVALLSQLASALTVVPLYWLARRVSGPAQAWAAVALWPLVPAVVIFMPKSDVLYPLLATACTALSVGGRSAIRQLGCSLLAGVALCVGMFFSFALAAVVPLMILAIVLSGRIRGTSDRLLRAGRVAAVAFGLLAAVAIFWLSTDHNLLVTWRDCFRIHATFYDRVPRSYWPWVGFNLAEFAVALGIPLFIAAIVGTTHLAGRSPEATPASDATGSAGGGGDPEVPARGQLVWAWWITLLALDSSGKNLGEVARLWMFLMPFAVVPAAAAICRSGSRPWLATTLQAVLALESVVFASAVQGFLPQ